MSINTSEKRDELLRLQMKLKLAEQSKHSSEPSIPLSEAEKRLNDKYKNAQI